MTNRLAELRAEASEATTKIWFLQSVEEAERTDITISLRLHIRPDLFVQIFYGAKSDSLYMALIEDKRRIFGIDYEGDAWHIHPYGAPERHEPLKDGLGPRPLLQFLAHVEDLLLEHDLL
jgi:hypothetical protein